jgi:RNA polymerase sigma factor (sigma-70 family)
MTWEEEIVKKCLNGDSSARETLYKHYAPKMLGVCMRYTKSLSDAEDVLQDGFIKVLRFIGSYKSEGSLEGWIRKIMVNTALNHYRSNLKFKFHEELDDYNAGAGVETDVYSNFAVEDLLKLIQNLPEGYRMVFNLYEIEGYSHKEISNLLGFSESTSKSQLLKARASLRNKLIALKNEMKTTNENDNSRR